ncbi:MAG: vWA domain-containing protein, partial [Pseudomonadota bacterium]
MRKTIHLMMAMAALLLFTCLPGCYRALLAGDPEGYEQCIEVDISVNRSLPEVLIALDRSNSMLYDGFWEETRNAIITITTTYEDTIMFGLIVFPDLECITETDTTKCSSGRPPVVGNALHNGGAIKSALEGMSTCGGTPVAHTMATAAQYLYDRPPENPKYILLATDGAPNCNESLDPYTCTCTCTNASECALCDNEFQPFPGNCLDDARTNAALGQLRRDGITTYVIALSDAAREWGDVLQSMAEAGGTDFYFAAD